MPTRPTSWRMPARRTRSTVSGGRPSSRAVSSANRPTRWEWLELPVSLTSSASAMLSSAASPTRVSPPPRGAGGAGPAAPDTSALEITVRSRPSPLAAWSAWSAARSSASAELPWTGNVAIPRLIVSPWPAAADDVATSIRARSASM